MSELQNTGSTCYDKYKTNTDIAARQKCMYTASGEMVCNVVGDGANVILKNTPYVPKCGQVVNTEATATPAGGFDKLQQLIRRA
jgi:hypothetical protein